jgi:SMI1 / KNR4 family (SUKH-1)
MDELLEVIQAEQRNCGELVCPPASPENLQTLIDQVRLVLGAELPQGYLDFLKRSDGLDYDGLVIYDSASSPEQRTQNFWKGFVSTNLAWHDSPANRELLIFGDSDMDLYVQHIRTGSFRRIDKMAHDRFEIFSSFEAMLEAALRTRVPTGNGVH